MTPAKKRPAKRKPPLLPPLPDGYELSVGRGPAMISASKVASTMVPRVLGGMIQTLRKVNEKHPELTPDLGTVGGTVIEYVDDDDPSPPPDERRLGFIQDD